MKPIHIILIIAAVLAAPFLHGAIAPGNQTAGALIGSYNQFDSPSRSKVTVASNASTSVLSALDIKQYAIVCKNDTTTSTIYLALGTNATTTYDIPLVNEGSCYEVLPENLYNGVLTAIAEPNSAASATLAVTRK